MSKPFTHWIAGRVVAIKRHGHTVYGNPTMSVQIARTDHNSTETDWYRISDNAGLVYAIENRDYRENVTVFDVTGAGRISGYTRTPAEHVARSMNSLATTAVHFPAYQDALNWYAREGFEDFTS